MPYIVLKDRVRVVVAFCTAMRQAAGSGKALYSTRKTQYRRGFRRFAAFFMLLFWCWGQFRQ